MVDLRIITRKREKERGKGERKERERERGHTIELGTFNGYLTSSLITLGR